MKPIKAWGIVYRDEGELHCDLMGIPSIGKKTDMAYSIKMMGKQTFRLARVEIRELK